MKRFRMTIMCRDIEASKKFYQDFVGLKPFREITAGKETLGGASLCFLEDESGEIEVELVCAPKGEKCTTKGLVACFFTDKEGIVAKQQLALDMGYNATEIRKPDANSTYFYVYDPDMVSIEFRVR
ncbi:VOC family protein [Sphaerochaeta halotolerans]|uniref:VOC family protein n=1 Tax=Sphaerochaeta halotolerans TaxID=2293840 RepID=UPI00136E12A8|nr:VOC family protein [Sphaerochaeta halotolerans]MBG0766767.1 VOC family protein [Spirochaetaceae bacterium]MXI85893.1 VOC family protein [Sphaerochaeta halotolerans]